MHGSTLGSGHMYAWDTACESTWEWSHVCMGHYMHVSPHGSGHMYAWEWSCAWEWSHVYILHGSGCV